MKTIGLLGGMSWESTAEYYRLINQMIKSRKGDLHSAKIVLYSVDFQEIALLQKNDQWDAAAFLLAKGAQQIEQAGADFLLICTNTMHMVASEIQAKIDIPLIHIADATAKALLEKNAQKVALLGTAFTMEKPFYKSYLENNYPVKMMIPEAKERALVHQIIYEELCQGIIKEQSKQVYLNIIEQLQHQGAEGVILGCTEIGMLIKEEDVSIPLFDTTLLHAKEAVHLALSD